jgi:predicted dithiol-disulfide oxidoreductase (DUF899 family)
MYHFMLYPSSPSGAGCPGCCMVIDHIPPLQHLNSRDTTFVAVAPAPVETIEAFRKRMDWAHVPFYSSTKTFENVEEGEDVTWKPRDGKFQLDVFKREGDEVVHTYSTTDRGVDMLLTTHHLLDLTPQGRGGHMGPFKRHDEYE